MTSKDKRVGQFVTSDWHVGHANVLKFDNRPFTDLVHMHRVLVNNFNSCVPEGSVSYFLGDMGFGNAELLRGIVQSLNGTKVLILGNHDKGQNAMLNMGFDVVLNSAMLYIAGQRVTMSHCPLRGVYRENVIGMKGGKEGENWHGETKQQRFSITDEGQFHLHGHIHSPNGGKSERILGKQMDVGVAANRYRPVSISEIESWIAKYGR
jgi:calcineurin-like phosphoesterase family protein